MGKESRRLNTNSLGLWGLSLLEWETRSKTARVGPLPGRFHYQKQKGPFLTWLPYNPAPPGDPEVSHVTVSEQGLGWSATCFSMRPSSESAVLTVTLFLPFCSENLSLWGVKIFWSKINRSNFKQHYMKWIPLALLIFFFLRTANVFCQSLFYPGEKMTDQKQRKVSVKMARDSSILSHHMF